MNTPEQSPFPVVTHEEAIVAQRFDGEAIEYMAKAIRSAVAIAVGAVAELYPVLSQPGATLFCPFCESLQPFATHPCFQGSTVILPSSPGRQS